MRFLSIPFLCVMLGTGVAYAQSLTPDQIREMVDQRMSALDPYEELLSDPNPQRAQIAMQIMMQSGDQMLRRMALDFGLFSPSEAVRRAALDAYFLAGPVLSVAVDYTNVPKDWRPERDMEVYRGSVSADWIGFFQLRVGAFDEERQCFLTEDGGECLIRTSDSGVALHLWRNWWSFSLDEDGVLSGSGRSAHRGNLPATINVTY